MGVKTISWSSTLSIMRKFSACCISIGLFYAKISPLVNAISMSRRTEMPQTSML